MKILRQIEGKLSLLLVVAIVVLCAGFVIMSCGKPQQKTAETNKGTYAIDYSHCPAGKQCSAALQGSEVNPVPDMSGREVTLEAWVKTSVTSTTGIIIKRSDGSRGVELHLDNNVPKFTIRRVPGVTGTEAYTADSGVTLDINRWYHIAGLIANAVHSHNPTSTAMSQTPHLDIYINGEYKSSASSNSNFADNPSNENINMEFLTGAAIDELRLWITGRTEAEINNCMNSELGLSGGCYRGDPDLAAYYRLNEGEGAEVTDFSGHGLSGGFEFTVAPEVFEEWEDGWVSGNTDIRGAD